MRANCKDKRRNGANYEKREGRWKTAKRSEGIEREGGKLLKEGRKSGQTEKRREGGVSNSKEKGGKWGKL